MSAIDELKSPTITLDTADTDESSEGIYIDASTENNSNNRVDLSSIGKPKRVHQIVNPKPVQAATTVSRKEITIDSVAKEDPEDKNSHVSPMDDIINIDNPNSLFAKYVKRKDEEAREWISEKQEEQELLREEQELELEENDDIINETEYVSTTSNSNISRDEDMDLSDLLDNEEEENNREEEVTMVQNENDTTTVETVDIDAEVDKTELPDIDEISEKETDNDELLEEDDIEVEEDEGEVIGKEPEEYINNNDDIDLEEEQADNFVTDIEEDEEDTTNEVGDVDSEEVLKHLQKLATEKLKPVSKKLDISSFTVLKKASTNINPIFQASSARVIKWVLPSQESIVLMKEFSGAELEKLREYSENSRSVDSLNRRFHMIYDHIVSPKPASFEQWLKSTPYEDIDHYFFAVYIASFKGANYLPEDCINPKCKETFLTEDINIMDMVKFESSEIKSKFVKLYQSETTPAGKGVYCTEIVPITNKIAIAFRQPSIYNLIEVASLDERSRAAYSHILDYIPYIDTIYTINEEEQTLTPINYKIFPDNAQRTIRSKVKKYDSIFSVMSVDEFGPIKAYVRAITEKSTGMSYVYPAVECPKCHTLTVEQPATAEELVFTRYQLGSLVTTSLN